MAIVNDMQLDLGPELDAFRVEMRAWIADNRVDALEALDAPSNRHLAAGLFRGQWPGEPGELADAYEEWLRRNLAGGFICPQWPQAYGGRGWDGAQMAVFNEELARARMPRATRGYAEQMVGPAVIAHGTNEQKAHFLPRIVAGEDFYVQGFSEPEAGSDLANVRTRGVIDGDALVISGQKIWTSNGLSGNKMFLLCRTDPAAERHHGISYVIVDIPDNHITFRETRQIDGSREFTEEFLDGARAPLFNVIGGLNNGWKVAMTTLGNERGSHATTQHLVHMRNFRDLFEEAQRLGRTADPLVRQDLAWAYTQVELMRFCGLRVLATLASGGEVGPESSMYKILASEYAQRFADIAAAVVGPEILERPPGEEYELGQWQRLLLGSRAATIMAGSIQIQRNVLGERVLGLPREPRAG